MLACCAGLVAACDTSTSAVVTGPPTDDDGVPLVQRSAESLALEEYYAQVQASLLSRGLLRTDGGGPDTPYTADDLVNNFRQIAFFEEYTNVSGRLVQQETESQLHRWESPVRIQVTFGETVTMETRALDGSAIQDYADRLAQATGHPIRQVSQGGNYHVFIVHEDQRRVIGPELRKIIPRLSDSAVDAVENMPRSSYCLVFAWDPLGDGVYTKAIAVIRAEHPDLFRLSCIHEEIAQGLGLANDSPSARPSIFNDDEEFGLLTSHDEKLLAMLFDERLEPGMTAQDAQPFLPGMASELMGAGAS